MLAGLVKSPSRLAPTRNLRRRASGARRSCSPRWPTQASSPTDAAKIALAHPPRDRQAERRRGSVNYVADWVMDVLDDLVGRVEQDIVVETTIDPALQATAEKALVDELDAEGRQVRRRRRARWSR